MHYASRELTATAGKYPLNLLIERSWFEGVKIIFTLDLSPIIMIYNMRKPLIFQCLRIN